MKMKTCLFFLLFVFHLVSLTGSIQNGNPDNNSGIRSFDTGWKFIKDNPSGAENPTFDDSNWRKLDVPHDWSIEDLPGQNDSTIIGPFSKTAIGGTATG